MWERGWLSNPLGGLFEEAQQRRLIDVIAGAAVASVLVAFPYSLLILGAGEWPRWAGFVIGLVGFAAAPVWTRRTGSVTSGALAILLTGIVLIAIPASYGGGAEVVFAIWFLMVPLLAGLFLGPPMALLSGGLGVALVSAFYLMARAGEAPEAAYGLGSFMVWLNMTLEIDFSSTVGALAARALLASSARLQIQAEELRESLDRSRASFEAAFDGILTIGEEGRLLEFNPAAEAMFGRTKAEVLGQPMAPLLIPERLRQQHESSFRRYLETGQERIVGRRVELDALRADGSEFKVELIVQPVTLAGHMHFTAYVRDLTEHYRAQKRLRDAERRVSQSERLEALGRLAGGVAHDFNNLLTAINGYAELLIESPALDEEARESAEQIHRAGQQASVVTQQLLAFSRTDRLAPAVTDVNQAIRDLLAMFSRLLPESIAIHTDLADDLWHVDTGPERLEQVLLDLILNAGDAMPGGGELRLTTRNAVIAGAGRGESDVVAPGEYVRILVADTGTGMDEETASRVFEPFYTTKPTGQGTGLGLATAYGSVRRCGGNIEVASEPGAGATFDLLLPKVLGAPGAARDEEAPEVDVAGETILVIEDQAALRRLVGRSLKQKGFHVLLAEDGLDALDRYGSGEHHLDLVITDVVMPRLGGPATVERLRETLGDFRVIFMSGYLGDARESLPELDDGSAFLEKPFRLEQLHAQIQAALEPAGDPLE